MTLELKKFDTSHFKYGDVALIIGKCRTGKSFLARDLLVKQDNSASINIVINNEEVNNVYKECVPNLSIHNDYNSQIIENIKKRHFLVQNHIINTERQECILVIDNSIYDNSFFYDKNIKFLFMNGRHLKSKFIITMRYPLYLPLALQSNIDYVFILRENITVHKRKLWKHYGYMFHTFEGFDEVLEQCTEDYSCLVVKLDSKSHKMEDCLFWYKAEIDPPPYFQTTMSSLPPPYSELST